MKKEKKTSEHKKTLIKEKTRRKYTKITGSLQLYYKMTKGIAKK